MNPPVRFHLTSALSGITISFLPPTCGPISNAGGWESDRAIAATKTVPRLRVPALVPWKLRGFQRSYIGSGAEIARPAAAARSNLTNNPYNLTFNLVISFYNFLDKIYRALHFASPTSLNLSRTSGSGLAVLLFYLALGSASLRELCQRAQRLRAQLPWTSRALATATSLSLMALQRTTRNGGNESSSMPRKWS